MTSATSNSLTDKQKKTLRRIGHALNPIILIGDKGLTENVIAECDRALAHHELVKVKARGRDSETRKLMFTKLCVDTDSVLVQSVGMTALLYRPDKRQPRIDINQ